MLAHELADALNGPLPLWKNRGKHVLDLGHIIPDLQGHVNPHRAGTLGESRGVIQQRLGRADLDEPRGSPDKSA
jgi:hypothetical protein